MPMNSDRLIIGYCNINNALASENRKMWSFFFLVFNRDKCSQCAAFRVFNSSIKFLLAFKPLYARRSWNEFSSRHIYLTDLLSFRMSSAKRHCGLIYMLKIS